MSPDERATRATSDADRAVSDIDVALRNHRDDVAASAAVTEIEERYDDPAFWAERRHPEAAHGEQHPTGMIVHYFGRLVRAAGHDEHLHLTLDEARSMTDWQRRVFGTWLDEDEGHRPVSVTLPRLSVSRQRDLVVAGQLGVRRGEAVLTQRDVETVMGSAWDALVTAMQPVVEDARRFWARFSELFDNLGGLPRERPQPSPAGDTPDARARALAIRQQRSTGPTRDVSTSHRPRQIGPS